MGFLCRDEDMQSLASLMSVKPTDIGNLDDFNESDEEEDKRSSSGFNLSTAAPGIIKNNEHIQWGPNIWNHIENLGFKIHFKQGNIMM